VKELVRSQIRAQFERESDKGQELSMGELIHVSKMKIIKEPGKDKVKRAYLEGFLEPLRMGVHGGIKKFYGVEPEEDLPATLDHIIAGVAG